MSTEPTRDELLVTFQNRIHYTFCEVKLLDQALTHSSWANEHGGKEPHNERLEFLGDAALELCVTQELFERFPDEREGEMTRMRARLVSQPSLSGAARRIGLDGCLRLGRGEESQGGRERASLLADAMEAVIGAIFLDGGFERVREVLRELFAESWPVAVERNKVKDFKSHLQELTQRCYKERPAYRLLSATGPEHAKVFEVQVTLPTGVALTATGPSLKRAEQAAARAGIELVQRECRLP
ncbi:ribonuclease III [Megalodesulfovibrio paquesii]